MADQAGHFGTWSKEAVSQLHLGHLRLVTGELFVQRYKRHSYELLQLTPGCTVLDIGCGLGDDATLLAEQIAPGGQMVGVDSSELMLQQAKDKHAASPYTVAFHHADARALPFVNDMYDAVRTDRTLQHIPTPGVVIDEIKRVLKPGGRVVCSESDWESLALDISNREIYRKIKSHVADDIIRNGWMGRQLAGMMIERGFTDVQPFAHTATFTDYAFTQQWGVWHRAVQSALDAGIITLAEADEHLSDVEERAARGQHLLTLTLIIVVGTKP